MPAHSPHRHLELNAAAFPGLVCTGDTSRILLDDRPPPSRVVAGSHDRLHTALMSLMIGSGDGASPRHSSDDLLGERRVETLCGGVQPTPEVLCVSGVDNKVKRRRIIHPVNEYAHVRHYRLPDESRRRCVEV